jgi:hypothetical protein
MGVVIGMDEAGYGPNFGPLVVTATVWEVPGRPADTTFWKELAPVVSRRPPSNRQRLHVADSKQVYSPNRGLAALERSVLATATTSAARPPGSFRNLCSLLTCASDEELLCEPWFAGADLPLPHAQNGHDLSALCDRWTTCCERRGIRLRAVRSDVVFTQRFNHLCHEHGGKGAALSRISLRLLRSVWDPDRSEPTLVIADKHGGRNRYDVLLSEVLDGQFVFGRAEGRERSDYRVGATDLCFRTRAEAHFPVAVASMVSKYVRELAMTLFNGFWSRYVDGLRPTQGYPGDSHRFRQDITAAQEQLGIPDDVLWRER